MANELDPFDIDTMLAQQRLKQAYDYQPNMPKGGMVGDVYVGAHPTQMLAEALRGYNAGQDKQAAAQELRGIGQQRQDLRNQTMANVLRKAQGTQDQEYAGPAPQGAPQQGGYVVPGQKPDLMGAYSELAKSGDSQFANAGLKGVLELPQIQMQEKAKADAVARQIAADAERERHNRVMEGNTIAAINARGSKQDTGKTLTSGEVDKITGLDETLGTQKRLMETFRPEYGGYKSDIVGGLANTVGAKFSDKLQPQAEWWAAHEANDNVMRNKLFGASLTAGEQAAWDRTSIKPGMTPSMIENRMAERAALIEAQRNTRLGNLGKAGYNVQNFGQAPDTFKPTNAKPAANPQDAAAMQWAQQNPNDPRAAQILQRLGGK